jgi:hypothetical protein
MGPCLECGGTGWKDLTEEKKPCSFKNNDGREKVAESQRTACCGSIFRMEMAFYGENDIAFLTSCLASLLTWYLSVHFRPLCRLPDLRRHSV